MTVEYIEDGKLVDFVNIAPNHKYFLGKLSRLDLGQVVTVIDIFKDPLFPDEHIIKCVDADGNIMYFSPFQFRIYACKEVILDD